MKKFLILIAFLFMQLTQAQTVQQVRDLINSNLASGTKITAEKHREVENAIVSLIQSNTYLYKGNFYIGDVVLPDETRTVTFPTVNTSNYLVVGSLVSNSSSFDTDNDVIWMVKTKSPTQFLLLLREVTGNVQNLNFNYALIPY